MNELSCVAEPHVEYSLFKRPFDDVPAGMLMQQRIPGNHRWHQIGNRFTDDVRGRMAEQLSEGRIAEPEAAVSVGMEQGIWNRIDQGL